MTTSSGRCVGFLALLVVGACLVPRQAAAVTPESPDVRATIKKALKFLETANEPRLGGKCLIGLAFLKDGADETHPKVIEAVESCRAHTKAEPGKIGADIYSTGIAIIFLCTLNPSKYQPEIVKLRDSLELRQKSHGGWGYPDKPTGDTSMTQYGVLSFWEMANVGIPISQDATERVADWLIRTQDPQGNWGYQGNEADGYEKAHLVKQDLNRHGMTAAGLGSTYMVADLLGISEFHSERDASLPAALKPVRKGQKQKLASDKINPKWIRGTQERGRSWMGKHYKIDPPGFTHYYLYALERCQSFMEAAAGATVKEPTWYNDGFAWLKKNQDRNGSWKGETEGLEAVNTAFGVLFLLRSTKKAIERAKSFGEGSLLAGRGLPGEAKEVRVRGGQIVPKQNTIPTQDLLDVLATPDHATFAAVATDVELLRDRILAAPEKEREAQLRHLRKLAIAGVPEARLSAVKVLSQLRDIESGTTLILALDDPDWQIVLAADEGLRFMGWKTSAPPLTDKPDKQTRAAAIQRWKEWYVSVRPDADFEN